jgi:hypothetical protein
MVVVNLIGGPGVLATYAWGIETYPVLAPALWGDVPPAAQTPYTANMFVAAAGYLAFTWYLFRYVKPEEVRVFGRGFGIFNLAYAGILIFSGIWMPLSLYALDTGNASLFPLIVVDLGLVAVSSLTMLAGLVAIRPLFAPRARRIAIIGAVFFCLQTVALDFLTWPWLFEIR